MRYTICETLVNTPWLICEYQLSVNERKRAFIYVGQVRMEWPTTMKTNGQQSIISYRQNLSRETPL